MTHVGVSVVRCSFLGWLDRATMWRNCVPSTVMM
jgi:hypothetical protein